jgi:biotin carboxylase
MVEQLKQLTEAFAIAVRTYKLTHNNGRLPGNYSPTIFKVFFVDHTYPNYLKKLQVLH